MKNCLNLGIAWKGGGGFQASPNCLEHFLLTNKKIWALGLPKLENLDLDVTFSFKGA